MRHFLKFTQMLVKKDLIRIRPTAILPDLPNVEVELVFLVTAHVAVLHEV